MKFNTKNKNVKRQPVTKTYVKKANSVSEMVSELLKAHEHLSYILIVNEKEPETLKDVTYNVLTYVAENAPDIETLTNMSVSCNIRSNKVIVHTYKYFGFSWMVKYQKNDENNASVISSIELRITLDGKRSIEENEESLFNNGWEVLENDR